MFKVVPNVGSTLLINNLILILFEIRLYIWEILSLTINKMSRHVDRLTRELNEAREKLRTTAATSNSSDDSDTETEKAEPKPSRQSATTFGGQVPMDVDDNVTEEMVERMEEKLEMAQADQKNLFLIVFQVFVVWSLCYLINIKYNFQVLIQ